MFATIRLRAMIICPCPPPMRVKSEESALLREASAVRVSRVTRSAEDRSTRSACCCSVRSAVRAAHAGSACVRARRSKRARGACSIFHFRFSLLCRLHAMLLPMILFLSPLDFRLSHAFTVISCFVATPGVLSTLIASQPLSIVSLISDADDIGFITFYAFIYVVYCFFATFSYAEGYSRYRLL